MNPNERLDLSDYPKRIDSKTKKEIRKLIRGAIQIQNNQTLFSCFHCIFYTEGHCEADFDDRIMHNLVQPYQLPECFMFDSINSAFAAVLELFHEMKIDFHKADHGWPTIVGRVVNLTNKYGYFTEITQKNLHRYG